MSQPSIYPALYVKPPDVINALQQYATVGQTDANTAKLQAETATERERPALTQAQTAKMQIENELAKINLGVAQYGLGMIQGGGNQGNEALPGGAGSQGSSYAAQPDTDPARYATATPPPTTGQQAVVDAAADKYGVPKELAYWVGTHESGWNRDAVGPETSSGRARGAWQFMDSTAKDYGLADPTDFATSTDAAMHKLSDLYKKTGDWGEAVRQYGTFSTGRGAGRDAAVHTGFDQYAAQHGFGGQRTQVAAAGNGPASWGGGGGQPGAAPPAATGGAPGAAPPSPGGGGTPNALAVANPMGTSSQGIMMPGLGVALPRYQALSVITATDKIGALDKVMTQRRLVLGNLAGQATDAASWNNNVAQAWRMGYLTNAEFQQFYGHYSPGLQQWVIQSLAPAEAQMNNTRGYFDKGYQQTPGGPQFRPDYKSGELVTYDQPIFDENGKQIGSRPIKMPANQFYGPGGPGYAGGGGAAAPAAGGGGTAAAPPPAAGGGGAATTAPNGGTVSGTGAEQPAAQPPAASGGAGTLPPGAVGAGNVSVTPEEQKRIDVAADLQKKQNEIQLAQVKKTEEQYGQIAADNLQQGYAAPKQLVQLSELEQAAHDFTTGPAGQMRAAAYKRLVGALGAFGIEPPAWLTENAAGAEVINKLGTFLAGNQAHLMGDKAAAVFNNLKTVYPNIDMTKQGYTDVLQAMKQEQYRARDLARFQEDWTKPTAEGGQGHRSIAGMNDAFEKAHPMETYSSRVIPLPLPPPAKRMDNVIYRNEQGAVSLYFHGKFWPPAAPPEGAGQG